VVTYSEVKARVIELLRNNPEGLTGRKIGEILRITSGSMSKYLGMMYAERLVNYRQIGRAKLWFLNEMLRLPEDEAFRRLLRHYAAQDFPEVCRFMTLKDGELMDPTGFRNLIIPSKLLVDLYETAMDVVGKKGTASIFFIAGKRTAMDISDFIKRAVGASGEDLIRLYAQVLMARGWGKLMIIEVTNRRVVCRWGKSIWGSQMPRAGMPVDHFAVGGLEGIAERAFGGKWTAIETKCTAKGDNYCEIIAERRE